MQNYTCDTIKKIKEIVPSDMEEQARNDPRWRCYRLRAPAGEGPDRVWILWYPEILRAGICWGGVTDWTDADSPDDAYERYFGIDGKEMSI
jgi:hypothetical protein